jgi:UTP--glucose-1-phosphate uridylyltransferase
MQKVRKAIIPAAGYGTRFLPATKSQPKEMMPIVDKPIIQYVIEDAVAAGITDIIIVTGANKRSIEDHFDHSNELEKYLKECGKNEQLDNIKKIAEMANFIYIRQKGPYGNGTPIKNCRDLIGDEPFVVLWGDDFIYSEPTRTRQLIDVYEKFNGPVISLVETDDEGTNKYGIADTEQIEDNVYRIKQLIEKPGPEKAPSRLASVSGFLLTPDIFPILDELEVGKGGELWLSDAMDLLREKRAFYGCQIKNGKYYDCGNKLEWIKANIDFAMRRDDFQKPLTDYMAEVCKSVKK